MAAHQPDPRIHREFLLQRAELLAALLTQERRPNLVCDLSLLSSRLGRSSKRMFVTEL